MRLFPPVGWFGRLAARPDRIGEDHIPAGAILVLSPWLIQRDLRFWQDPHRFDPGRLIVGERPAGSRTPAQELGSGERQLGTPGRARGEEASERTRAISSKPEPSNPR